MKYFCNRTARIGMGALVCLLLGAAGVWWIGPARLVLAVRTGFAVARGAPEAGAVPPAADHAHEEDTVLPITLWGPEVEVFFECPCYAGETPTELVVHVTDRATGKPIERGSVTVEAVAGSAGHLAARSDAPARPGIFILSGAFPQVGEYRLRIQASSPQLGGKTVVAETPALTVHRSRAEAASALAAGGAETAGITFLKEQQWPIGMRTAAVGRRTLSSWLAVPGQVVAPPTAQAVVAPPMAGKILPPRGKLPAVGDAVEAGQVLALIEPPLAGPEGIQLLAALAQLHSIEADLAARELESENRIQQAQIELGNAERHRERLQKLSQPGVVAGKELFEAEVALELWRSRLAGAREQRHPYHDARARLAGVLRRFDGASATESFPAQLRWPLVSPLSGTIVETHGTAGQLVDASTPLFKIVDLRTLWIEAKVSEYDVGQVEKAVGVCCRLSAYPEETFPIANEGQGRPLSIGALVDAGTRTVPVRFEVPNASGRLRVGMFTEVLLETQRAAGVLAVPKSALVEESGQWVVFVQKSGERFEKRPVSLGVRDLEHVEIQSGLAEGEQVVVHGAYAVRLAGLGPAIPEHHHH